MASATEVADMACSSTQEREKESEREGAHLGEVYKLLGVNQREERCVF